MVNSTCSRTAIHAVILITLQNQRSLSLPVIRLTIFIPTRSQPLFAFPALNPCSRRNCQDQYKTNQQCNRHWIKGNFHDSLAKTDVNSVCFNAGDPRVLVLPSNVVMSAEKQSTAATRTAIEHKNRTALILFRFTTDLLN